LAFDRSRHLAVAPKLHLQSRNVLRLPGVHGWHGQRVVVFHSRHLRHSVLSVNGSSSNFLLGYLSGEDSNPALEDSVNR
jgi:hypothetical protein